MNSKDNSVFLIAWTCSGHEKHDITLSVFAYFCAQFLKTDDQIPIVDYVIYLLTLYWNG